MESNATQNPENFGIETQPMLKQEARILTPKEYNRLRDAFREQKHKLLLDGMLYTAMRIEEFWRFLEHPEWFNYDRMNIHLPKGASLKVKAKMKERDINLSALGVRVIRDLVDAKRRGEITHISRRGWNDDLVRAARRAGLPLDGIVPKMTRKTYISWLMAVIPDDGLRIAASSGHSSATMITHYMNTPFSDAERNEIKLHIQGWNGRSI
jgi:integrase